MGGRAPPVRETALLAWIGDVSPLAGQPAVAKLEKRSDMRVGNLRRYVEALGGRLEIRAHFPDADVLITPFDQAARR